MLCVFLRGNVVKQQRLNVKLSTKNSPTAAEQ